MKGGVVITLGDVLIIAALFTIWWELHMNRRNNHDQR